LIEVLSRSWTAFSRPTAGRRPRRALALMAALAWLGLGIGAAQAVQSVRVPAEADAIDLTSAVEHYGAQGDRIQVSTAPGADGIVRRIEVSALEAGAQPAWIVFALTNDSDEQLSRLVVAPHFRFVGSGVVWPDLGSSRITAITASQGSPPEREDRLEESRKRIPGSIRRPGNDLHLLAQHGVGPGPRVWDRRDGRRPRVLGAAFEGRFPGRDERIARERVSLHEPDHVGEVPDPRVLLVARPRERMELLGELLRDGVHRKVRLRGPELDDDRVRRVSLQLPDDRILAVHVSSEVDERGSCNQRLDRETQTASRRADQGLGRAEFIREEVGQVC